MATRTNAQTVATPIEITETGDNGLNDPRRFMEFNGKRYDLATWVEKKGQAPVQQFKTWDYLLDKEPGSNVYVHIALMQHMFGENFAELAADLPRFVQAYLAVHRQMQESVVNKDRDGYRPTTVASVVKRTHTLLDRQEGKDGDALIGITRGSLADEAAAPAPVAKKATTSRKRKSPVAVAAPAEIVEITTEAPAEASA